MQAYFDSGDEKYLRAAVNGFRMIAEQSFATGGMGSAGRLLRRWGRIACTSRWTGTHSSFETPCGSYAQFKISRGSAAGDGGCSLTGTVWSGVMLNTVLGAKAHWRGDGSSFYYADYASGGGAGGRKRYHGDKWPCCSGTIGQVTADYRISTYFRDGHGVYVNLYVPSTAAVCGSGRGGVCAFAGWGVSSERYDTVSAWRRGALPRLRCGFGFRRGRLGWG